MKKTLNILCTQMWAKHPTNSLTASQLSQKVEAAYAAGRLSLMVSGGVSGTCGLGRVEQLPLLSAGGGVLNITCWASLKSESFCWLLI